MLIGSPFVYVPCPSSAGAPTYTMNESSGGQLFPQAGWRAPVALMKLPGVFDSGSLSYQPASPVGFVLLLVDMRVRYRNWIWSDDPVFTYTSRYIIWSHCCM